MKLIPSIFTIVIIFLTWISSAYGKEIVFNHQFCHLNVSLTEKAQNKQQTIKLNNSVSMQLTNIASVQSSQGANVASNITCQQVIGAGYTGSSSEWKQFFDSALQGMLKANFKNIQLTLVGDNDKVFHSLFEKKFISKEYTFTGNINGNKQMIKNLALLDKVKNTLYTFSVSGNTKVKTKIEEEFERLLTSIKLIK